MERQLKATGVFFGLVFFLAALLNFLRVSQGPEGSIVKALLDAQIIMLLGLSGLLCASGFVRFLIWVQPLVMFAMTPLPFISVNDSFYGLGFYVVGVVLLFRLGFYDRYRILKFILSILYLFACELITAFLGGRDFLSSLSPLFFISFFLIFLYLAFKEKLAVYLREPKPLLSLKSRGLSGAECIYVKAIAEGNSSKEVAIDFSVSESTVRNTLSRAYKKLGVEDKTGIVAMAEKFQILD
jgi:DNA-binding CsgD family transcriptional regulator